MNCPKCGSSVGKNDEYCGSCGYHLVHNGGAPAGQGPHKKKKKSGLLIFAVILEIAAIVAVACVLFFGFSDKKDSSSDKVNSSGTEASTSKEKSESKKTEKGSDSEDKKEAKAESDVSSKVAKSSDSADKTGSAEPAPDDSADEAESAEPAPDDSEDEAESAEPAPGSTDDTESAESASDSEDDTESAEPAPDDSEDEAESAEPAPDSTDDTDSDEAASEPADSQEAEQSKAYLIADNTDLLDEIKRTYTRITEAQVTSKYASSTIEQDLVENDALFVLNDNDTTNWQEGVQGSGIGEYIEFTFDQSYPVEYMTFKLGNWKTEEYYNENYRPKALTIRSGDYEETITFADEKQEFLVQLDPEVDMTGIRITIADVYDSHVEWDDTPITEIGLWYK